MDEALNHETMTGRLGVDCCMRNFLGKSNWKFYKKQDNSYFEELISEHLFQWNSFIEGSIISAQALFSLRVLFGAKWAHSYRRASLIRTRLSDVSQYTQREVGTFDKESFGYSCTPG